jgi:1-acyl-sn-glycerol-3-phosphate acyltransferase
VLAAILLPLSRLRHRRAPAMERAAACQRWLQRAFVLLFDYMRLWGLLHFHPRRVDASTPGQRFVMVANHPTLVDIAALSAVFGRIVCVAKPLLFRAPFLGRVLRACVYLEGGEMEGLAAGVVVKQALDRLAQSMPMLVFPEGTRSPAGGLRPFRRGAFEIACRANVPVVPILIRCEPAALGKGTPWYAIPPRTIVFTVTRLPAMSPAAFGGDASSLTAACEATFRRHLGLPNPETPTNHE